MPEVTIRADARAAEDLARDIRRVKGVLTGRLAERGYQLLREEVPVRTGNLKQGVAAPEVDAAAGTATLTVSARSARLNAREGVVYGSDGKERKRVSLSPAAAFNYAAAVASGRPAISPKAGKALLIPVPSAPSGESYLIADGQVFIFRRSAKATKANPFQERAGRRLEGEAERIADEVLRKVFV